MSIERKQILIWGAGKIGRGFIADLFYKARYQLTFVDSDQKLIHLLNSKKQYTLVNIPSIGEKEEVIIQDFNAFHTTEKDQIFQKLSECSFLSLVVYPSAFEPVAKDLAQIIKKRSQMKIDRPLDILLSTNIFHPSKKLHQYICNELSPSGKAYFNQYIGLVNTLIIRMCIEAPPEMKEKDPLIVLTNGYPELTLERDAFKGEPPNFKGLIYTTNIAQEEIRKLYTYNTIHAVYAYLGKLKGYQYIIESIQDDGIQKMAEEALHESSRALQKEFGFSDEEMQEWNKRVLKNMANPILKDKIDRVGADPIRKLQRDDRLIGPALLCIKHDIQPVFLIKAIAAAFHFSAPEDQSSMAIQNYLQKHSIEEAIQEFCHLDKESEFIQNIAHQYRQFMKNKDIPSDVFNFR